MDQDAGISPQQQVPAAPPPAPTPPPPLAIPVQQVRRGGRGWMVLAIVLLLLLTVSVLLNIGSFFSVFMGGSGPAFVAQTHGPRLEEVIIEDDDTPNKIAIVELQGIISSGAYDQGGFSMVEVIKTELNRAAEDHRVKAAILKVDSPGGEVLASDEIYRAILDFQKKSGKPVIASMGDVAASGGYYASAPCRWIVANELTLTGSIGVIMHSLNYRGLMDKVGLRPEIYKGGAHKDMLSGAREPDSIPQEERDMIQRIINQTHTRFKSIVAAGREQAQEKNKNEGRPLSDNWEEYADGRVLSGKEAYDLGFVDQLGNFEDAVSRAKRIAGITAAKLIEYQLRHDLSDLLRIFGRVDLKQPALKVDLGLDMPKLKAGQLYYLSPLGLQ